MKPILLLYPPFEGKNILKSRAPFPIGPLYISAYLKKQGIEAFVKDFSYPSTKHRTKRPEQLKTGQPNYFRFGHTDLEIRKWLRYNLKKYHNIVGVSSLMSSNWSGGYRLIDTIKSVSPESIVIIGGPHATAFPDHVTRYSKADYICIGEGEDAFYKFLKGEKHEAIVKPGKSFECRTNFFKPLDDIPFPERTMLMDDRKTKDMYMTFSRGCPHKCSFCGSYLIQGRIWRNKSVDRIIEEIDFYYKEWGIRHFIVEDDNPCPGKKGMKHIKEMCKRIITDLPKIKLSVSHGIPVYATADKELCELLWLAGFRNMVFPLESTDPNVLKDMNKEFTPPNWKKAVKTWKYEKNHPTEIIIGYPFVETIETMLKTIIAIAEVKARAWASHFRLNKGTPMFKRCLDAGYVKEDYDPINTQAFYIQTERFSLQDLKDIMAISRGVNFATENGFDPFKERVDCNSFTNFRVPKNVGDIVAEGKFKFRRSQNTTASIMLTATGKFDGKPIVVYDNERLTYKGSKPNKVYNELKYILTGKKPKEIGDFLK